jgi:hypothetical protein
VARPLSEGRRNPTIGKDEHIRTLVRFDLTRFEQGRTGRPWKAPGS